MLGAGPLAPDVPARPAQRDADGLRQHHAHRGAGDPRRDHAELPRPRRPDPGLVGHHARRAFGGGRDDDRRLVVHRPARASASSSSSWPSRSSARPSKRSSTRGCVSGDRDPVPEPALLDLRDVTRHLPAPPRARCPPCAASTSRVRPGEVVGLAGESGCGKSTLVSTVLRLQPTSAEVGGEVLVLGAGRADDQLGQAPRGALGRRVDRLPGRAALAQPGAAGRAGRSPSRSRSTSRTCPRTSVEKRVEELLEQVGLAARPQAVLPAPALRRAAPARDDRDGAGLQAPADRGRRAHHRARRDGAGADPRPAQRPGPRARRRAADHQPRPVGARRRLRPGRGDVRRPHRRVRHRRAGLHRPAAPVHRRRCPAPSRGSATRRPATPRPG